MNENMLAVTQKLLLQHYTVDLIRDAEGQDSFKARI